MPRQSVESRAAAAWRGQAELPPPPESMNSDAKKVWNRIVADRPPDYFRPGALELLELFCESVTTAREQMAEARDDPKVMASLIKLIAAANLLASRLRLSPAAYISSHSRKQDEGGLPSDPLLGGHARKA